MKVKHVRNMRDIPTIQGLRNRAVPTTREQIMSELARLEHEKARLERELGMWLSNQKKTLDHIQQVQERVDLIQNVLNELFPKDPPGNSRTSADPSGEDSQPRTSKFHEFSLEY